MSVTDAGPWHTSGPSARWQLAAIGMGGWLQWCLELRKVVGSRRTQALTCRNCLLRTHAQIRIQFHLAAC